MPIHPPALDDRSFNDLTDELLQRIPAHTPEWTNPQLGDPGRTIIELFAWLTDTLLYRVNLVPERQRLAFLRLLGLQMRPAVPATAMITLQFKDDQNTAVQVLQPLATVKGPVNFETRDEITVLPVSGKCYYKRPLSGDEMDKIQELLPGLAHIYGIRQDQRPRPYATTPLFPAGVPDNAGWDMTSSTDGSIWIALLAPKDKVLKVRESIGEQRISIGIAPSIEVPGLFEDIGPRGKIPHVWEITTGSDSAATPALLTLDFEDSTGGLRKSGVVRLKLPRKELIGAPLNDVRKNQSAGVGPSQPPRIDDPEEAAMIVTWLRMRPALTMQKLALTWAGVNAAEIEQLQTISNRIIGQSNGAADQEMQLPAQSVERTTFMLSVEEPSQGFVPWQQVDDLAETGRDARVYQLDGEAGVVRFGDGLRGKIPENQQRVMVVMMRAGGGKAGNLPPGSLTDITGKDASNNNVTGLFNVLQTMQARGGDDSETLLGAEKRIPGLFRHRDRAITEDDYKQLALQTPGVDIGRVEPMPRFKPQQRKFNVPGVVSVMVLPQKSSIGPPNPRPDRPTLETAHAWLSQRTPLATELYVIGCEYVPLSVTIAISIMDGFGHETVLAGVRDAMRLFLWPLQGGGTDGLGWRLGRSVRDRELDVMASRVPGVDAVNGLNLFRQVSGIWQKVQPASANGPVEVQLLQWQLPELLHVFVAEGDKAADGVGQDSPAGPDVDVAIPVVPEVC